MVLLGIGIAAALIVLSAVGLAVAGLIEVGGSISGMVLFGVLSFFLIAAALGVILERSPIRSAMSLVAALFLLAVVFITLDAPLIAALQVIVYAGAIVVLFLFVIMLLNLQREPRVVARVGSLTAGVVGGSVFLLGLVRVVLRHPVSPAAAFPGPGMNSPVPADFGTIEMLGTSLFTQFLFAFEVTSAVLLVSIVGAMVLAKRTWV